MIILDRQAPIFRCFFYGEKNEILKSDDMGNNTRNAANHDRNSERNEEES